MLEVTAKSRTSIVLEQLREEIVNSIHPPGQKLKIETLARGFGASPGAVREALSRLTAEGLVTSEPQKGFMVAPISRRDLVELTEVRVEIEGLCLSDSIANKDADWDASVLSLQQQLQALDGAFNEPGSDDARKWHALHFEFHETLASRCRNRWWLHLRAQLYLHSERYRRLSGPVDSTNRDITAEHNEIANAAIAGDASRAQAALSLHLCRTTDILLTADVMS